jgi:hypothetical protein
MRAGAIISGGGHAALIALVLFGLPERARDMDVPIEQVSTVSLVSAADFDAAQSSAPNAPEALNLAMAAPREDTIDAPDQITEDAPQIDTADAIDAPDEETAPDVSALKTPDPEIVTELEAPTTTAMTDPVGEDTPLIDAPTQDGSINSTQTAMAEPARPNLAPRVDTTAAPKPPSDAKEAEQEVEEVVKTPDPDVSEPEPEPEPVEEIAAAAPQESTTEIVPDAKAEESPLAPTAATRPKGRPKSIAKIADAAQAPQEPSAEEIKEREQKIIEALTAQAAREETPEPSQETQSPRLGTGFNFAEQQGISAVIGQRWNKSTIEGKENYERLVIVLRVRLSADGKVMGGVEPVEPASPSGDFKVAYEAARRAVMRAQPIPLPKDKFRDGDYLEIRFDPGRDVSLN